MNASVYVSSDGRSVHLDGPEGPGLQLGVRWLIDHAEGARNPISGQRAHRALELTDQVRITEARLNARSLEFRIEPSGHTVRVGLDRLIPTGEMEAPGRTLWPTPEALGGTKPMGFDRYQTEPSALAKVLARVAKFGLMFLDGAGGEPGTVEQVVERFGFLRETNYGRVFDVRIEASPTNLAFSDRGLELHTDNPYRDPPPTLQLLHALVSDPSGGETLFVDGFAQAESFRRESPEAFELLARTPARFRYADASGACWTAAAPIISLDAFDEVETLRLNHRALDLPAATPSMEAWYDAYLAFYRRVHAPEAALERTLRPGEIVIFDNRRILHGRRGLSGGSQRWLQGCYADRDGLLATLARLEGPASGRTR
jgi:gamma-butyrobetaine dioxygenase